MTSVFNLDLSRGRLACWRSTRRTTWRRTRSCCSTRPPGRTRAVLRGQQDTVRDLRFSNSGDVLAAGTRDGEVLLFDVAFRGAVGPAGRPTRPCGASTSVPTTGSSTPAAPRACSRTWDPGAHGRPTSSRSPRSGRAAGTSSPTSRPTGVGSPTGGRTRPATGGCGSWTWARARSRLARGCRSRRVPGWPPRGAGTARTYAAHDGCVKAATVSESSVVSLVDSRSGPRVAEPGRSCESHPVLRDDLRRGRRIRCSPSTTPAR